MALNNPYASYLDGNDDYIQIPASALVFGNKPRTYSFYYDADKNTGRGMHLLAYGVGETGKAFGIQLGSLGAVYLNLYGPGQVYTIYDMFWGGWLDISYDGTTVKVYLDGQNVYSKAHSLNTGASAYGRLGQRFYYAPNPMYFKGIIDEFRSFNYALTEKRLDKYRYRYLLGDEPGLLGLYRFDEGTGNIAHDSSPNASDGTIVGATWIPGIIDLKKGDRIIGSITFRGQSSMFLSAVKTAVGKITFRGGSFMSLIGLVLRELEGVYQISSSEIVSRNQPVLSTDLANYIEVWINPRVPADQAEEVYRSKEPEPIPPGGSKTFNLKLDKEPVIEAVASLEDAGANLSITDTKFYSGSAEITVRNSGATEQTCIIVVQARPLELQGRRKIVVKDEESILDHGLVKYTFDSPLVQDEASARDIGKKILWLFSVARANIEIEWRGDPALELADPVQIPEFEKLGVSKKENFYVVRQLLEVVEGGLDATLSGRKIPRLKEGD